MPQPLAVPLLAEVTTNNGDHGVDKVRHLVSPQRLAIVGEVFALHSAFAHVVICPSHVAQIAVGLPEVQEYQKRGGMVAALPFSGNDVLTALQKIHAEKPRCQLFSFD